MGCLKILVVAAVFGALAACSSRADLEPVPEALVLDAVVPGFETERFVLDLETETELRRLIAERDAAIDLRRQELRAKGEPFEIEFLALSGGGQYGAFSAGILTEWQLAGTRPEFDFVSGISTGSIIAPFIFLGPEYDDELTEIYTTLSTEDVARPTVLSGLLGRSSLADTTPLKEKIASYITQDFLDRIAAEHATGRRLLVGTTNIDAARPVVWDMGAIAASSSPSAPDLFRSIILASSAIPVAFPPVFFEVEAAGERYYEMHVDGGVMAQVSALSPQIPSGSALSGVPFRLFVIVNGEAEANGAPVPDSALSIGGASINALWYAQTRGDLYRLYATALRDGINPQFAWIGRDFTEEPNEEFDPAFMQALFDHGQAQFREGRVWKPAPPGFATP